MTLLHQVQNGEKLRGDNFWFTIGDVSDCVRLCDLIIVGKTKAAIVLYENMDTAPREKVPCKMIDALYKLHKEE